MTPSKFTACRVLEESCDHLQNRSSCCHLLCSCKQHKTNILNSINLLAVGVAQRHALSMQVKHSNTEQARKTKMAEGKDFVVYYGTGQLQIDVLGTR